MPTQERLRELFLYDEEKGLLLRKLCWACGTSNVAIFGSHGEGYITTNVDGSSRLMHRLVWVYFNGPIPSNREIDHIDGDRANNRLSNLRLVTRGINNKNSGIRTNSTSGVVGVSFIKGKKRWVAYINVDGKRKHIGDFKLFDDAVAARQSAEPNYGYYPNNRRQDILKAAPNSHRRF